MTTKPRILIAEDNPIIFLTMQSDLEDAGCEVSGPYASASQALAAAETERIDLALIDIDLGKSHSGLQLAEDLCTAKNIPCVFVTGQIETARAACDHTLGALQKPFSEEELVAVVRAALSYHQDKTEPPTIHNMEWYVREEDLDRLAMQRNVAGYKY